MRGVVQLVEPSDGNDGHTHNLRPRIERDYNEMGEKPSYFLDRLQPHARAAIGAVASSLNSTIQGGWDQKYLF